MKGARRNMHRLKRGIAWLLTAAIVAGNVSQMSYITSYASETATDSQAGKAFEKVKIQITQSEIEKVLNTEDFDELPELDEEMVPFKGNKKDALTDKIYELMEGRTLIRQEKIRNGMYLILADNDSGSEEDLFSRIHLIGINGYSDREYHFLLQLNGDNMVVESAAETQYEIVGEDEAEAIVEIQTAAPQDTATPGNAKDASQTGENEIAKEVQEEAIKETPVETVGDSTESETKEAVQEEKSTEIESTEEVEKEESPEAETELSISANNVSVVRSAVEKSDNEIDLELSDKEEKEVDNKRDDIAAEEENVSEIKEEDVSSGKSAADDNTEDIKKNDGLIKDEAENSGEALEGEKEEVEKISENAESSGTDRGETVSGQDAGSSGGNSGSAGSLKASKPKKEEVLFEIRTIKDETELTSDDINLLMGKTDDQKNQEKKVNSIQRLLLNIGEPEADGYYQMSVGNSGITELSAEVSLNSDIFSQAEEFWGKDAENHRRIANVRLKSDHTGDTKAGEPFHLTVSYGLYARPIYTFGAGSVNFYDEIENASISLTVPSQLLIKNAGSPVDNGNDTHTYILDIGTMKSTGSKELTACFAGNGEVAIGKEYSVDASAAVSFTGTITIKDPTGQTDRVEQYTLTDVGMEQEDEEEPQEDILSWIMVSPDKWTITKTILNSEGQVEEIEISGAGKKKAVKFEYELSVGLKVNDSIQSEDKYYFEMGRAAFEEGSFLLKDRAGFFKVKENKSVTPLMMSITSDKGKTEVVYNSSEITTDVHNKKGFHGSSTELYEVDDNAPSYTTYRVKVYYPYEEFELNYWDPRVNDGETYSVENQADISYKLYGNGNSENAVSETVTGKYQYAKGFQKITIKKNLIVPVFGSEDFDTIPYNKENAAPYPGFASFSIEKKDEEGNYAEYPLERVMTGGTGGFIPVGQLLINPIEDDEDMNTAVKGEDGSISFYVEAGQYRIKETQGPLNTSIVESFREIDVREREGTVKFDNKVVNKGGIQFTKKGEIFENNAVSAELVPLKDAEFGIYKSADDAEPIIKSRSNENGIVIFYPLDAGDYVVKEMSVAGNEHLADTTISYPVTVTDNKISGLSGVADNTIVNKANSAALKVTKYLKDFTVQNEDPYKKLTSDYSDFSRNFEIQRKISADKWEAVPGYVLQGLESTGENAGTFTATLPVYEKTEAGVVNPITYRVKEELPAKYTAENIAGEQYVVNDTGRSVVSVEFTLTEQLEKRVVRDVSIKNIPRGALELVKNRVEYKGQQDGQQKLEPSPEVGRKFYLFRKSGDSFEVVPYSKGIDFFITGTDGKVLVQNLDVQDGSGYDISYYWYEADQTETEKLFAFDRDKYGNESHKAELKLEKGNIVIDGKTMEVQLIGPFQVRQQSEVTGFAYNVAQKVPYWVVKKDAVSGEKLYWAEGQNEDERFEFKVYDIDGSETATAYNDGKPVYLEIGKLYKIRETYHPGNYSDYKGEETLKDQTGYYQKIDLTSGFGEIDLNSAVIGPQNNDGYSVEFKNEPKKLFRIDKFLKDSFDGERNDFNGIKFNIYTAEGAGDSITFKPATSTALESGTSYWVDPGTYYIKEIRIPEGYIDPAFYLTEKEGTVFETPYYKNNDGVYYGPINIFENETETVTVSVDNVKNTGYARAFKYDTAAVEAAKPEAGRIGLGTRIGLYKEINNKLPAEERTADANLIPVDTFVIEKEDGIADFKTGYPVYDEEGNKITYVIREVTPPEGYDLDPARYELELEPGKTIEMTGKGESQKLIAFYDNPLQTLTVYKYWYSIWESKFHEIYNELSGIKLALYEQETEDGDLTYIQTMETQEDGSAVFKGKEGKGLDRTKKYYVIEVYGDPVYELPSGKNPLLEQGELKEPETIPAADVNKYNYVFFEALDPSSKDRSRTGEIYNEEPWVQFNLHKYADKEIAAEEGQGYTESVKIGETTYYAKDLDHKENVNGAKFELYGQDISGTVLNPADMGELIGTYETGTRLDSNGSQLAGEFMTTILKPGRVYWLKEISAGPGYTKGDDAKVYAFVPEGKSYSAEDENVEIIYYKKNDVTYAEAFNYKNGPGVGPGNQWLAYVKLNKWLETRDGNAELKPLGGVAFELRIAGKSYALLETGLDNDFKDPNQTPTGQAMSGLLNYEELKNDLMARMAAGDITQERFDSIVNEENHTIEFELVEIKAPERVELLKESYSVTVEFNSTGKVNDQYFYEKIGDINTKLLNKLVTGYPVTVRTWGYQPNDDMFGEGKPKVNDQFLETKSDLEAVPLSGISMTLYKYNATAGKYEEYQYENGKTTISTNSGEYIFKDGLPKGKYCLVQNDLGSNANTYYNMYPNESYFRYFTVEQTQNVVNLYNPELPSIKITKQTLLDEAVDLTGVTFMLDGKTKVTKTIETGSNYVTFENIHPGTYTLKESGSNHFVSSGYLDIFNTAKLVIGFENKNDDGVYLKKLENSIPLSYEGAYLSATTIRDPRKSSLKLVKQDAETNGLLQGAKFKYQRVHFSNNDFKTENGIITFKHPDGPVTDAGLLAQMEKLNWGNESSESRPTSGDGTVTFENLDPGWYKITETTAPTGYEVSESVHYVAVTADMTGNYISVTADDPFKDKKHVDALSITKTLDFGEAVHQLPSSAPEMIRFDLYIGNVDENGEFKGTETGKNIAIYRSGFGDQAAAQKSISDIRQLTDHEISQGMAYYLKETVDDKNKAQWQISGASQKGENLFITLDGYIRLPGFNTSEPVEVNVTNKYLKSDVTIKKVDRSQTDQLLSGAEFKIYDSNGINADGEPTGNVLGTSAETGTGIYQIKGIPLTSLEGNRYYIFETKAPSYYVRKTEPLEINLLPGENKVPDTDPGLVVTNESGVDVSLIKYGDLKDNIADPVKSIQESDVVFNLYSTTSPDDGNAVWKLEKENCMPEQAASGRLEWKGLSVAAGKIYAVYEKPITEGKYENYTLHSVYGDFSPSGAVRTVDALTEDSGGEIRTLHVLEGMSAGASYTFRAYDKPAQKIIIRKTDYDETSGVKPEAVFEVRTEDGMVVKRNIRTEAVSGMPYTQAVIQLEKGTYRLVETEAEKGYSLMPDDIRVISDRLIRIPDDENRNTYYFTNMKVGNTLEITKNLKVPGQKLNSLWWNDNQTVTYRITPAIKNDSALTGFQIRDEGLIMVDSDGNELNAAGAEGNWYTDGKYSFSRIRIPEPVEGSYLKDKDGVEIKPGEIGGITAKITFEYFGGEKEVISGVVKQNLASDGYWTVIPSKDGKVKSFSIDYYDTALQEKTDQKYSLGQDFVPGAIEAEVVISQQKITDENQQPKTVSIVRNTANTQMTYISYDEKGIHSVQSRDARDSEEISVLEPDLPTVKIGLSVKNQTHPSDEGDRIEIGDVLQYTMTLENVSDETIKSPMLSPQFLNKLPKGAVPDLSTVKITTRDQVLTYNTDEIVTAVDSDGYTYLYVSLKGEFRQGDFVTITFDTKVTSAVINNGNEVRDSMYVTSTSQRAAFTNNYGGATFKVWNTEQEMDGWPGTVTGTGVEEVAKSIGLKENNGYAATFVKNTFSTDSAITLLKEGRGDMDVQAGTGFVSGLDSAKVTRDGSIKYHLITKNTADKTVVTRLRVLDVLPKPIDKENFDGQKRGSEWQFNFIPGTIKLYIASGDEQTGTEVSGFHAYYLPESETLRKTILSNYADPEIAKWVTDPQKVNGRISAIMVDTESSVTLKPGDRLIVEYDASVQEIEEERDLEKIAYKYSVNDFSVQYYYKDDPEVQAEKMNDYPMTSNLVQAVLVPGRVGVGGRIWIDANGNGIQDDTGFDTEADLQKLINAEYFNVALRSTGEEKTYTPAKKGLIPENPLEEVSAKPEGILNKTGEYLFSGLLAAQPNDESRLYTLASDSEEHNVIRNILNSSHLKGAEPETHKLLISTQGEKSADIVPGMILEKSPTTIMEGTALTSNPEGGKSRKPGDLDRYPDETKDNNYIGSGKEYQSETFFLWADKTAWDRTKDFGVIPYRNITLKKTGITGEAVKGAKFTIYGPFTAAEEITRDPGKIVYPGANQDNRTDENGYLNGIPKLLYYMNYLIVEDEPAPNFVLSGASANLDKYHGEEAAWILKAGNVTAEIKNQYETGTLIFDKIDGSTGKELSGAVFSITRAADQGNEFENTVNSGVTFAEEITGRSEEEKEAMGIMAVRHKNGILYFATTGKQIRISGIPNGKYILKEEKAPDFYNSLIDQNVYGFTVKGDQEVALSGITGNSIANSRGEFELSWIKKDIFGQRLKDIEFTVDGPGVYDRILGFKRFKPDDNAGIKTIKTDEMGKISLNVPFGDYRITERPAPGYVSIDTFYIRVDETGTVSLVPDQGDRSYVEFGSGEAEFIVINTPNTGSLEMEKVDSEEEGRKLAGAEFRLTGQSEVPGAWNAYVSDPSKITGRGIELLSNSDGDLSSLNFRITGTDGILGFQNNGTGLISNLPFGTYRLTETKAPEGYLLGTEPWTAEFTINDAGKEVLFTTPGLFTKTSGPIPNTPSRITVIKTNAVYADTRLKGAEFILRASDGRYVKLDDGSFAGYTDDKASAGTFVTDGDGQFIIKRLPKDTYTFIETKAPSGYYINSDIPPVTLDGINSFTITIQDQKIRSGGGGDSGGGRSPGGSSGGDSTNGPGVVTIIPDPVPLAGLPGDSSSDLLELDDGNVPLARLPKTGERSNSAGKVMVAVSGFMMALYAALMKKKKEN
ncbi:doubled motif LPXTG anchor domain-containing protein [Lachnospiraceae bacterium 54-53]